MIRTLVTALVVSAVLSTPTYAQDRTRLIGLVTDAQNAVLPGVTVTARSPSLIGTQTAVTETDGRFRIPSLPPGRYALTFELNGFQTLTRENIVLALGQTLAVDGVLQVAGLQETVTVTSESPVIDVSSTKMGAEFSAERLAPLRFEKSLREPMEHLWKTHGEAVYDAGYGGHVLIQVHDELCCSVKDRATAVKISEVMRDAVKLEVPVKVDVEIGPNWRDAK